MIIAMTHDDYNEDDDTIKLIKKNVKSTKVDFEILE